MNAQSCPTLSNPRDCSTRGSPVHGIFPARILSGLPFPPPGDLPHPGIEPAAPASPALAGRFFTTEPPGKPKVNDCRKEEINTSSLESGQNQNFTLSSLTIHET